MESYIGRPGYCERIPRNGTRKGVAKRLFDVGVTCSMAVMLGAHVSQHVTLGDCAFCFEGAGNENVRYLWY